MLHRSYMRRGVSLEVIVEEDDHAEVSLDPVPYEDDLDSSPQSSTSSTGADTEGERERNRDSKRERRTRKRERKHSLKLRDGKEKRKRQKEEEEEEARWRFLERQRSLSCETLTILDVGDDDFSREQWEEEARDWDSADGNGNEREIIQHCISRRKILEEASRNQDQYKDRENRENLSDEGEFEISEHSRDLPSRGTSNGAYVESESNGACIWSNDKDGDIPEDFISENSDEFYAYQVKVENRDEIDSLEGDSIITSAENIYDDVPITDTRSELMQKQPKPSYDGGSFNTTEYSSRMPKFPQKELWLQDSITNDDAWITVGELENGIQEKLESRTKPEQVKISPGSNESKEYSKLKPEDNIYEDFEFNVDADNDDVASIHSDITVTIEESMTAIENSHPPKVDLQDNILSVRNRKDFFENKQSNERTYSPLADRLSTALANPEIMIIERSPSPKEDTNDTTSDEETSSEHQMPYNVHNMELHPEELPPPNTVSSVRQIFEIVPKAHPPSTFFELPCRFDHVRSNPTSKILRFDRDRRNQTSASIVDDFALSKETKRESESSTVNINGAAWRDPLKYELNDIPNDSALSHVSTNSSLHSTNSPIPSTDSSTNSTHSTILSTNSSTNSSNSSTNSSINSTHSSMNSKNSVTTGVNLRKPRVVSKFDVRKALQENPRYFHIRVEGKGTMRDEEKKDGLENGKKVSKIPIGRRNTITYSYLEAKHQKQRGTATTLRWTRETIDRSDAESMSSESSEDSGVSRDFSSTIISSFSSSSKKKSKSPWNSQQFIKEEYASDPSFKWIEPSVLSKIRSMGTTVIYFGPRRRPQPGVHPRNMKRTTSPLKPSKVTPIEEPTLMMAGQNDDETFGDSNKDLIYESVPHPRQITESVSDYVQTDVSFIKKDQKRKSTGNNSIVYDFTQKQAANGFG